MKQKVIASLCALALLLGMIPAAAVPASAAEMTAGITHATTTINNATGEFKAGFAKICINPTNDESLPLGGYDKGTTRVNKDANGNTMGQALYMDDNGDGYVISGKGGDIVDFNAKLDGLFATAIALQDRNGHIAVLISMDGITTGSDVVTDTGSTKGARTLIVKAAKEQLDYTVESNSIMVNASHSHSGIYMYGTSTADYRDDLRGWLTTVAVAAMEDMQPATISMGSALTENMNFDRHYYTTQHDVNGDRELSEEEKQNTAYISGDNKGPWLTGEEMQSVKEVDPYIYMLQFTRTDGTSILLANWRAHPKCNSTRTSQYGKDHRNCTSSDYVNTFRYELEQQGYRVAFFQGAAGNVNTYSDVADATNTETLNENGDQTGNLYGKKLAEDALDGLSSMEAVDAGAIRTTSSLETGNLDYSKKDLYNIISVATVSSVWESVIAGELTGNEIFTTLIYKNDWDSMKSMTVMDFMADYFNYSGAYDEADDQVNSDHEEYGDIVDKVAKALQTHYKINSKYHLNACYDDRNLTATTGNFTLYAISIGDSIGFVFAPFELFDSNYQKDVLTELDLDASYGRPFVIGYSNSGAGYMPDSDAYEYMGRGSYEVNQTDYAQGTAEAIAARTVEMLNGLQAAPTAECAYCGAVDWYSYDNVRGPGNTTAPVGHYYLTQDWEYGDNYQKQVNGQLCLHLNGHSYANQSTTTGKAFVVNKNGVLNLMGTGVVEGQAVKNGSNGGVIEVNGGEVNVYSGVTVRRVDNTDAAEPQFSVLGGIVYIGSGEFNLRGGILENGIASAADSTNTYGGGVYVKSNGTFKLHSGIVQNCNASRGGAVCNYGTTQLLGGSITGSDATVNGGAVYNAGTLTIDGTNISQCTAGVLGGSIYNSANVTLTSGEINGGHAATGGNIYNDKTDKSNGVFVQNGGTVTGGNSTGEGGNIYNKGTYEQNTDSLVTSGVATSNGGNIRNAGIYNQKAGTVSLGDSSAAGGNVYNTGTYTLLEGSITDGETLVEGSGSGGNIYQAGGSFTVGATTDTDDTLPVISGGTAKRFGGNAWVHNGTFTLYSGTVSGGTATKYGYGHNIQTNGGITNLFGGKVVSEKNSGTNIRLNRGNTVAIAGDFVLEGQSLELTADDSKLNLAGTFTGSVQLTGGSAADGRILGTAAEGSYLKKDGLTFGDGTYKVAINGTNELILTNGESSTVVCQILNADRTVKQTYTSFAAAVEDFDAAEDGSIKLLADLTYIEEISKEVTVEMNSKNMAASILECGAFYGIEHVTDDFDIAEEKVGVLTVFAGAPEVESTDGTNRYMALPGENSTYTFHAFKLDTKKGLRSWGGEDYGTGLYYQGVYEVDQMVAQAANNGDVIFGIRMTLDKTAADQGRIPIEQDLNDCDELLAGRNVSVRAAIYGMMPRNNAVAAQEDPDAYIAANDLSKYPITSLSYFKIGDTYLLDTDPEDKKTISLKQAILRVDAAYSSMNPDQKEGLNKMAITYTDVFASWTTNGDSPFENIGKLNVDISDYFSKK